MHSDTMGRTRIGLLGARAALQAIADTRGYVIPAETEMPIEDQWDIPIIQASPYARGNKPREESFGETVRKDFRKKQVSKNKAQGYGKRLTKKDKLTD